MRLKTLLFLMVVFPVLAIADNVSEWATTAGGNNTGSPPDRPVEGMAPSTVNDTMREMMAAIARWYSDSDGTLTTGGSGNAYTLTTNSTHAALADQPLLVFRANRANTGAATLNVDGLGAKSMRINGDALVSGQIVSDKVLLAAYNATDDAYDIYGVAPNISASDIVTGTLADSRLSTNVPLLDATNVFSADQVLSGTDPDLRMVETNAPTDEGTWFHQVTSGRFCITALNDALSASNNALCVNRTGTTLDLLELAAASITANGSEIITQTDVGDLSAQDTINNSDWSGTDLAVTNGGTGSSTASGARTNLGVGTGDSPQFTAVNVGHASDTTLSRDSAGKLAVEGRAILSHDDASYVSGRIIVTNTTPTDTTGMASGDVKLVY